MRWTKTEPNRTKKWKIPSLVFAWNYDFMQPKLLWPNDKIVIISFFQRHLTPCILETISLPKRSKYSKNLPKCTNRGKYGQVWDLYYRACCYIESVYFQAFEATKMSSIIGFWSFGNRIKSLRIQPNGVLTKYHLSI